MAELVTLQKV